jgi:uncharacterized Fe-S cluster-containing radical SAM superfamily protein
MFCQIVSKGNLVTNFRFLIRIQHFRSVRIRIRFRINGFDDQNKEKITAEENEYFFKKDQNYNLLYRSPP